MRFRPLLHRQFKLLFYGHSTHAHLQPALTGHPPKFPTPCSPLAPDEFPRYRHRYIMDIPPPIITVVELSIGQVQCESTEQEKVRVSNKALWPEYPFLTVHNIGVVVCGTFATIALSLSFYLIWRHATHYLRPYEQKHIIRILFMVPVYVIATFLSYVVYHHALYFDFIRDCYEAVALASFFTLLCHYVAPNLHDQKEYFRGVEPKNWLVQKHVLRRHPMSWRRPRSGLTWFNIIWFGVFQYCFFRPLLSLIVGITHWRNLYCRGSHDPRFAYVWVTGFLVASVTIAMYTLVHFFRQLRPDLGGRRPVLKFTSIKLVIFFCFWQNLLVWLLLKHKAFKKIQAVSEPDWRTGLPCLLICVEMSIFSYMHLHAFEWRSYDLNNLEDNRDLWPWAYAHGPWRALVSALNPWDIVKAVSRAFYWMFVGVWRRENDSSYDSHRTSPPTPASLEKGDAALDPRKRNYSEVMTKLDFRKSLLRRRLGAITA
ncbi:DUF300-domain-containing protein [Sporormia fimetaria CBS 119925]|uniref:DUF300-domain-containing protein n=1 Tax=Sporormia fimetaria CBS 119925 TaxID=1340428 RepID=A0A6A6VLH2_9PLEO|nr:DUF300-domain-containing protein [Sporormia fimetaria CBS 119925]